MHDFILKEIKNTNIENELDLIGFDSSYTKKASEKFVYKNIKIFGLTVAQANILKQTAISVGADCATHRETITAKVEKTDCILGGSISQLNKIAEKLTHQPFGLKELSELLKQEIKTHEPAKIVGILNLTKDSFSDGGLYYDYENAIKHFDELVNDGADIIDIGAESTKPDFEPVAEDEQLKKLIPIIEYSKKYSVPVSVDTRSAKVAEECLKSGAKIINDVSGLEDDENMADVVAKYGATVVIQHRGNANIDEIFLSLKSKINYAKSKGVENIIIDPGVGFGKTKEQNFEIIKRVGEFKSLGYPVMLGISRKSFINSKDDALTLALNATLINDVDFIRVHNVKLHRQYLELYV